jgi:hypothetical protein
MTPLAQVERLTAFPLAGWAITRTEPPAAPRRGNASTRVAVLIPCRDEAAAIGRVVRGFRAALPDAVIYVYDNNSTDGTAAAAAEAGALVRRETLQGKGHVVRRMFADIEADCYILVDGDDTYDPATAPALVDLLCGQRLDMVNAARRRTCDAAYRPGHKFGNRLLGGLVRRIFGARITDILSGYRAFSRRYVKTFPALAQGFEIETEFTVHALDLSMPLAEIEADYRERPAGSASKLRTYRDGLRILRTIVMLVKEHRPLWFFTTAALALLLCGLALGAPVVSDFLRTGLVPRLPTAVLALGIVVLSFLSLCCGLILDSVARGRKEIKRIAYLAIAAPGAGDTLP